MLSPGLDRSGTLTEADPLRSFLCFFDLFFSVSFLQRRMTDDEFPRDGWWGGERGVVFLNTTFRKRGSVLRRVHDVCVEYS